MGGLHEIGGLRGLGGQHGEDVRVQKLATGLQKGRRPHS